MKAIVFGFGTLLKKGAEVLRMNLREVNVLSLLMHFFKNSGCIVFAK